MDMVLLLGKANIYWNRDSIKQLPFCQETD
jgi:hypothetical protein